MENDSRFRHELKYLINKREMDCCIGRLSEFAQSDTHAKQGSYFVRSLYFDDMYQSAYEDKENGVLSRCKFRIRTYDHDSGFISLEKKIKEGSYVRKESARLTKDEYDTVIKGNTDFLLKRGEQVAKDIALEYRTKMLRPEVLVDYDRIPYIFEFGSVRVTFDLNIRAGLPSNDIFSSYVPTYDVLGTDLLIMEVKYTEFLPDIFRSILPNHNSRLAFSKYTMSIDTLRRIKSK